MDSEKLFLQRYRKNLNLSQGQLDIFGENYYKFFFSDRSCVVTLGLEEGRIGTILQANSKIRNVFGYSKQEIEGKDVNLLIPPDFHAIH